jgi:hypothetical protein
MTCVSLVPDTASASAVRVGAFASEEPESETPGSDGIRKMWTGVRPSVDVGDDAARDGGIDCAVPRVSPREIPNACTAS